MRTIKKINNRKGFTLAETLLAVLIMLLVSTIVVTGIPAAKNAYEKVIIGANAQVLLSTAATSLRGELGTSKKVKVDESDNSVYYYSASTNANARIFLGNEDADSPVTIMQQDYLGYEAASSPGYTHRLVSEKASTEGLYVKYDNVEKQKDMVVFKNVNVYRGSGSDPLASLPELKIRIISGDFITVTPTPTP